MKVPLLDLQAQYRTIEAEVLAAVQRVLESQQFILGPEVRAFEEQVDPLLAPARSLGVSNGTDALLLALMALEVGPGDEVIVPPFTFFATAAVVLRVGAKPVFVDIEPETFNINAGLIEAAITPRTKVIMPVHLFGQCADMRRITAIAEKRKLKTVEDAAQALAAKQEGRFAGSFGDIACVSFYPTKNLGAAGEAGLAATKDPALYEKLRILRNQGMEPRYEHHYLGGNFRMDAMQGAILGVKLKHLAEWNARRVENATMYNQLLASTKVKTPVVASGNTHVYHQYTIRAPNRDGLRAALADQGIGTDIYYPIPLHLQPCMKHLGHKPGDFPVAERAAREVLALPIYPELTREQIRFVADAIRDAII